MKPYRAIAEYYDAENENLDMLQRDVPFLLGRLPRKSQSILELAVGTARAAIPLAQAGHRIVGVDYAPDMLQIARRKRDGVGLTDRQLQLINADITRLSLRRRFDWICILFNTFLNFTTLKQQDRLLQVVRRHLKPRTGRFWLDIFQPNLELLAQPSSEHLAPTVFYVASLDRTVFRETQVRRDPARQVQHVTHHYRWFDAHGIQHHQKVEFDLTFVFPRELRILLERNGMKLRELYGDYDGSALGADSPRMIACASPM
ncbi:class I SAM-dependent methyltransferase [Fontivita pretiosa]|uniref:class I SAM-dependent methyltransferase n=1 Tax=Fontivita pretiosa TaxID=2989684 RepID=UPI003D17BC27